jgi:hypothetical protein
VELRVAENFRAIFYARFYAIPASGSVAASRGARRESCFNIST